MAASVTSCSRRPSSRPEKSSTRTVRRAGVSVRRSETPQISIVPLFVDGRDQHRREEAPRGVLQRLPAAVVVDARPGGDRPAVVELPVEAPPVAPHRPPVRLGGVLDDRRLQHLPDVEERGEVLGRAEVALHVFFDERVAARVALVREHDRALDVPVGPGVGVARDRAELGERLEAVLAHEARDVVAVGLVGVLGVPDAPVVHVAPAHACWRGCASSFALGELRV